MENPPLFNPLDKRNLGNSVVDALLESDEIPLGEIIDSGGAGIYAIYYRGTFEPYRRLVEKSKEGNQIPIYVGKAIPKGGRKGAALITSSATRALTIRLQQHAASISAVSNLELADFSYRRLVVDDIWISLGEAMVVQRFQPIWNTLVEGFGNHDPGAGRYRGKRPLWDEFHPGRRWAEKCGAAKKSSSEILEMVRGYEESIG